MVKPYSPKSDLWSVGTILYQCLTGKPAFPAQSPQELRRIYETTPGLKPNIPPGTSADLEDLLLRLLRRAVKERIEFAEFFVHPFLKRDVQRQRLSTAPTTKASAHCPTQPTVKPVTSSPAAGDRKTQPVAVPHVTSRTPPSRTPMSSSPSSVTGVSPILQAASPLSSKLPSPTGTKSLLLHLH